MRASVLLIVEGLLICLPIVGVAAPPITLTAEAKLSLNSTAVGSLAFAPDGRRFAAIDKGGMLQTWDALKWKLKTRNLDAGNGRSVAFWTNDEIAATWGAFYTTDPPKKPPAVMIWNCESGLPTAKLPIARLREATSVCVSNGPRLLVSGATFPKGRWSIGVDPTERRGRGIEIWSEQDVVGFATSDATKHLGYDNTMFHARGDVSKSVDSMEQVAVFPNEGILVAAGKDGVAAGGSGIVSLFSMKDDSVRWRRVIQKFPVTAACFCSGWQRIAVASSTASKVPEASGDFPMRDAIRILSVASGKELLQWPAGHDGVTSIAGNGELDIVASGGRDGRISLWRPNAGIKIVSIETDLVEITALKFSDSGNELAAGGKNGQICIYKLRQGDLK